MATSSENQGVNTKAQQEIDAGQRPRSSDSRGKADIAVAEDYHGIDTRPIASGADEVYERKVAILNQALIDIGMGGFQWKVFAMTGFGWFVDNVRHVTCYHSYLARKESQVS